MPLRSGEFLTVKLEDRYFSAYTLRVYYAQATILSGTLTLPNLWVNAPTFKASIIGASSATSIAAAAVTVDTDMVQTWLPLTANAVITPTLPIPTYPEKHTIRLFLRDENGQSAQVLLSDVKLDTQAPTTAVTALPFYVNRSITLFVLHHTEAAI